ncbi:hypothetical protein AB6E88_02830 [Providencia hangzhouensis]
MHIKKVIFAFSLITFGAVSQAQVINNNNPLKYRHFKTDYTTMLELAKKNAYLGESSMKVLARAPMPMV